MSAIRAVMVSQSRGPPSSADISLSLGCGGQARCVCLACLSDGGIKALGGFVVCLSARRCGAIRAK